MNSDQLENFVPRAQADAAIAQAEAMRQTASVAIEQAAECEAAREAAEKRSRDLELSEAKARVERDGAVLALSLERKRCEQLERDVATAKADAEKYSNDCRAAEIKCAAAEARTAVAEKRPAKSVAPMLGYSIDGLRRDSNGDLSSFNLNPRKAH